MSTQTPFKFSPARNNPQVLEGLALVRAVVRQVRASVGCVLPEDEMNSLGNEGLVNAMMRFDPDRGVEFRAFASPRIRGAILDGMRREGWMPRRAWARASEELGGHPFDREVQEWESESPSVEDLMMRSEEALAVRDAVDELAPDQAELVQRHDEDGESLSDIAQELGYSRSWASRSLATAHDTIRTRLGSREGSREVCRSQGRKLSRAGHPGASVSPAQASTRHPGADLSPAQASTRHPGADLSPAQASTRHPGADLSPAEASTSHPGADSSPAQALSSHPGGTSGLEFNQIKGFNRLPTVKVVASEGSNRPVIAEVAKMRRLNRLQTPNPAETEGLNRLATGKVTATGRLNRLLSA